MNGGDEKEPFKNLLMGVVARPESYATPFGGTIKNLLAISAINQFFDPNDPSRHTAANLPGFLSMVSEMQSLDCISNTDYSDLKYAIELIEDMRRVIIAPYQPNSFDAVFALKKMARDLQWILCGMRHFLKAISDAHERASSGSDDLLTHALSKCGLIATDAYIAIEKATGEVKKLADQHESYPTEKLLDKARKAEQLIQEIARESAPYQREYSVQEIVPFVGVSAQMVKNYLDDMVERGLIPPKENPLGDWRLLQDDYLKAISWINGRREDAQRRKGKS